MKRLPLNLPHIIYLGPCEPQSQKTELKYDIIAILSLINTVYIEFSFTERTDRQALQLKDMYSQYFTLFLSRIFEAS